MIVPKKDLNILRDLKYVDLNRHKAIETRLRKIADMEEKLSEIYERLVRDVYYTLQDYFTRLSEEAESRAANAEMLADEIS